MKLGLTNDEYLSVRIDVIWWSAQLRLNPLDIQCLKELGSFLRYNGNNYWKKFSELWQEYQSINDFNADHDNPGYSQKSKMTDMRLNGFYFGVGIHYEEGEPMGVLMDQPIEVNFQKHKQFFFTLFPFRFIYLKGEEKIEFLNFHLAKTFNGNHNKYREFLNIIKVDSATVFGDNIDVLNQYIDHLKDNATIVVNIKEKSEFSYSQVALSIALEQKVKSRSEFSGNKQKELQKLAKKHNLKSWNKLQQEYNRFTNINGQRNGADKWSEFLLKLNNTEKVRELLRNDPLALQEIYNLTQKT